MKSKRGQIVYVLCILILVVTGCGKIVIEEAAPRITPEIVGSPRREPPNRPRVLPTPDFEDLDFESNAWDWYERQPLAEENKHLHFTPALYNRQYCMESWGDEGEYYIVSDISGNYIEGSQSITVRIWDPLDPYGNEIPIQWGELWMYSTKTEYDTYLILVKYEWNNISDRYPGWKVVGVSEPKKVTIPKYDVENCIYLDDWDHVLFDETQMSQDIQTIEVYDQVASWSYCSYYQEWSRHAGVLKTSRIDFGGYDYLTIRGGSNFASIVEGEDGGVRIEIPMDSNSNTISYTFESVLEFWTNENSNYQNYVFRIEHYRIFLRERKSYLVGASEWILARDLGDIQIADCPGQLPTPIPTNNDINKIDIQ